MSFLTHTRCALLAGLLLICTEPLTAAETPHYNQIHLQAQSSMTVGNDHMEALLSVFGEGSDTAKLTEQINSTMSWALKTAKQYPKVSVSSGQYQTYPVFGKDTLKRWRATQEVSLESADTDALVQLLGALQQHLQVNSIRFSVSPPQRAKTEDQLIDQALAAFQARAERVRKNLGAKSYRIVDLNVGSSGGTIPPYPMMRTQAMESSATAPAVESGTSQLTVNAEGTIELQF
jgi:predicted secreted protein